MMFFIKAKKKFNYRRLTKKWRHVNWNKRI
jgi:hypothetical protein